MHPLVIVCGPTGSGKSGLAVELALRFSGEVVNCDSVQVYRGFEIGAAKISLAERRGVPHHLLDVAGPAEIFTAGDYARQARAALADIVSRGRLPVVCGGTGLYLRALLEGLFEGPPRDAALRARLLPREAKRPGSLHKLLRRFDPAAAVRIHANDVSKVLRALEVILTARRPLTEMFAQGRDALAGYRILKLGLDPPRAGLYARLDARAQAMFDGGIVEETRALLAAGCPADAKPLAALGYAQALAEIHGVFTRGQAVPETQQRTRQYAKRQWTWFRRDQDVEWLRGFGADLDVQDGAREKVARFLAAL